jgi:hypothetical protein
MVGLAAWLPLLATASACRSEQACLALRAQGFEVVNQAHPCNDDSDCRISEWPTCGKPLNARSEARLQALEGESAAANCRQAPTTCPSDASAFCDRNFCIARPVPYRR